MSKPPRSTISKSIRYFGGHVVVNPHLHVFTLTVDASAPIAQAGPTVGMGLDVVLLERVMHRRVARVLGGHMVWWPEDTEALKLPLHWSDDIDVPAHTLPYLPPLPHLLWEARPTLEHLAMWAAAEVAAGLRAAAPEAVVHRVVLRETPRTAVVVDGAMECSTIPGPLAHDAQSV